MRVVFAIFLAVSILLGSQNVNNVESFDDFDSEFGVKKEKIIDPLSGYNRVMTHFNDFLYTNVLSHIANGYRYVVPKQGRTAIGNFFDNLMFPVRFVNNILQFKFKNACDESLRFVANTIVGFAGISDVATTYYKIPKHSEDFGQTLGYWGVGSGFHIVWPLLGPSNLRDSFGLAGDYFSTPITYVQPKEASMGLRGVERINTISQNPTSYEDLKKNVVDLYPFLRDVYEQRREKLIKE